MSISRPNRFAAGAIAVAAAGALLAGCSSDSSTTDAAATAAATTAATDAASPSASSAMVGGDPSTWAPVEVTMDMNGQVIGLKVGQAVNFVDIPELQNLNIMNSNPAAIEVALPTDEGGVQTGAGAQAVGPGASHVIIGDGFPADGPFEPVAQFIFQVTNVDNDGAPGNWSPQLVDDATKSLEMVPGESAVITNVPSEGNVVASSDEMAVMWTPIEGDTNPSIMAVGEGTSTITVQDEAGKAIFSFEVTVKPYQP